MATNNMKQDPSGILNVLVSRYFSVLGRNSYTLSKNVMGNNMENQVFPKPANKVLRLLKNKKVMTK